MAEVKHIDVYEFWMRNGRYPDPVDYVNLIKADKGSFSECDPSSGKLYLVTGVQVKVDDFFRGKATGCHWVPNEIQCKWGMARGGRGDVVAEGSLQLYERSKLIEQLLADGRIRQCGTYNPQSWELSHSFVRDVIQPIMDQDYAIFNERTGRGPQPKPGEPKPHPRNTVPLEKLRQYGLHVGTEIFRVCPGQKITCRWSGLALENDEITGACLSSLDPDGATQTAVASKLIERVGAFGKSSIPWEEGKIVPVYDKNKQPAYPAWRDEEF